MDAGAATHGSGEPLRRIQGLLIAWGAAEKEALSGKAAAAAAAALHDASAYGSALSLVRSARRTAAGMRERLSEDFWKLLLDLEKQLASITDTPHSEAELLARTEAGLRALASLSGLAQENMNRVAGWRFLDIGRRIERGINACRITRHFAGEDATQDELDLLLDLVDSQITYRSRYMVGIAMAPVRDLVMLDPFNPRSAAFQVETLKAHLASLPPLHADGMPEEPSRLLIRLASEVETARAGDLNPSRVLAFEQMLMKLSDAISARYFLQGSNATPTKRLSGLA
jgi:uncharacterized alpha-E superfamily protein